MHRLICLLFTLASLAACQSKDLLLPKEPAKRQKSLSEGILDRALRPDPDPATQADLALAVSEVVITGHAPRLRLIATNGSPVLAKAAARALVKIRVLREADRAATLKECAATETNALVQAECAVMLKGESATTPSLQLKEVVDLLESKDLEQRRAGLRALLASPSAAAGDERLDNALYHRLYDADLRVRVLTSAVYLRRSLVASPFAIEENAP